MLCNKLTEGARRAILLFAGWGMDAAPFTDIRVPGFDLWVAHSYDTPGEAPDLTAYAETVVVAWSYGALPASHYAAPNVTKRVAVNATLHPVDDLRGIPAAIYRGTLHGLSDDTLTRFRRRMCGTRALYDTFMQHAPSRSLASLRRELEILGAYAAGSHPFDLAYVADADRIIPTDNQRRCWQQAGTPVVEMAGAHLPADMGALLALLTVDKHGIGRAFGRAAATYDAAATVQRQIAEHLCSLVDLPAPRRILEVGPGTGFLTRLLARRYPQAELTVVDLNLDGFPPEITAHKIEGDAETVTLPEAEYDLITGASAIQWFHNPRRWLLSAALRLAPGGMLAVSTFGPDNFRQMRRYGRPLHYPAAAEYVAGPRWRVTEQHIDLTFADTAALLRHIRDTGVSTQQRPSSAESLRILREGINTITYHPLYITYR